MNRETAGFREVRNRHETFRREGFAALKYDIALSQIRS
jgi:hypothetical protein